MLSKKQIEIVTKHLGFFGRLVSGSKSGYNEQNPTHVVIFNSNIIISGLGKVWYGDIDITKDEQKLKNLASEFEGRTLYVLYEMDGRFENEENPKIENSVYITNGISGLIGAKYQNYFYRNEESGKIENSPELVKLFKQRKNDH